MADVFGPLERSLIMSRIRSKNTKPELIIRRALHRRGYRFTLHSKALPGHPDIVLPKYKTAIQVRGCFWHGHSCSDGHIPKSNTQYWSEKIKNTIARDNRNDKLLVSMGWNLLIIWECSCLSHEKLSQEVDRIDSFLKSLQAQQVKSRGKTN